MLSLRSSRAVPSATGRTTQSAALAATRAQWGAPSSMSGFQLSDVSSHAATPWRLWTVCTSTDQPIALATNDAGALISTTVREAVTFKPNNSAAEVTLAPDGPTAALTGLTKSTKGVETDYTYQLLFYVPPVESDQQIRLLGFAQAVTGAKELK